MIDPLAEVVTLLQPSAPFAKLVSGAGQWRVRRSDLKQPFFCVLLEGRMHLHVDQGPSILLQQGDFALIPAADCFTMTSHNPPEQGRPDNVPQALMDGMFWLGDESHTPDTRALVGHCEFGSPDAALLVSLLPRLVHVRDQPRLSMLVQLVNEESRAQRPARDVVLPRLLEVLMIEALRGAPVEGASGLACGLNDERLAAALRCMHAQPGYSWSVAELAQNAALSRSAFFERFRRALGVAPMEYLLAWRMALAKDLLKRQALSIAEVAEKVGYSSASTFSIAFTRFVGTSPARFSRQPNDAELNQTVV